jgi:hypothetical protein
MICRISIQNCVQDLFDTIFSRYTCYDTVSTYDTTLISLIINYGDTSAFCIHEMHDTSYDTTIVTSLTHEAAGAHEISHAYTNHGPDQPQGKTIMNLI